jgi:NADPH:quinone reductase-like Zn-dependent oxidoreductase
MKAAVYTQYGAPEVVRTQDVRKPTPGPNEILIRIKASAVNSGDVRLRKADPFAVRFFFGLFKPNRNVLGGVLSGEVEAVGKNVKLFAAGDSVFGSTGMRFGAHAEYCCLPETAVLTLKPENSSHQEAAVIPFGGQTALHFIRKAQIKPGQRVLINGATGAVGTAALQLAKFYGAHVTAVCSASGAALARSLGADHVIDYAREDFTANGHKYDVIFDTVDKISFSRSLRSLNHRGRLILGSSGLAGVLLALWVFLTSRKKVLAGVISETVENLVFLTELMEAGKLRSVIDRTYSLAQIAEAHRYVETGRKKGSVSIV